VTLAISVPIIKDCPVQFSVQISNFKGISRSNSSSITLAPVSCKVCDSADDHMAFQDGSTADAVQGNGLWLTQISAGAPSSGNLSLFYSQQYSGIRAPNRFYTFSFELMNPMSPQVLPVEHHLPSIIVTYCNTICKLNYTLFSGVTGHANFSDRTLHDFDDT